MRRHRFLSGLIALVALSVLGATCEGPDDLVGSINEFLDPVDLTKSNKPGEQAAGASADAVDDVEKADKAVDVALESKNPKKLDEAISLRPRDPRYLVYRSLVAGLTGQPDTKDANAAFSLHKATYKDRPDELDRRWKETIIEVGGRILSAYDGDTTPPRYFEFRTAYCAWIRDYESDYGSSLAGKVFLELADRSRC